jgi:PAS domain S-box-containing protein
MLFAQQLPNPILRSVVVLLSLSAPLFAGGHLLARLETGGYARIVLGLGVVMLVLGAIGTMAQFPEIVAPAEDLVTVAGEEETPVVVMNFSRWLGLLSLILGVVAILLIVARREWQIEEIGHRFQSLAEHMSEGFVLADADRTITLVNKSLLEMTGLAESNFLGRRIDAILSDNDLKPEIIRKTDNGIIEVHVAVPLPAGERHFWVSNVPIEDAKGNYRGSIATIRDMTEHRRMAEQIEGYAEELEHTVEDRTKKLARSEHRLHDLLLQMSEGIVTVDEDFVIHFVNNRFCEMVQISAEAVSGRSLLDFLPNMDGDTLRKSFGSPQAGSRIELEVLREDGTRIAALLARAPFHDEQGEGLRYSIVLTDVGELKAMQRQLVDHARDLEKANRELLQLDRAKDGFLTNVSHELRTPLSTIRGYLEMLRSGNLGDVAEGQLGAVDVMVRNTDRLSTLIAEMINFSRMQIQGVQLNTTLFTLDNLLDESIASAAPEALRRGIELKFQAAEDARIIWGDAERVGQVLAIFLSNGIKFCNEGGVVNVSADCDDDGTVRIVVRDSGIGIPQGQQNRIFDKFYQVDSSLNRRYEGAGIGLSIAKSLAEAHGGHIDLVSEVGEGSVFTLVLPEAVFDPTLSVDSLDLEAVPVLLVIEDAGVRNALRELLIHNGASVLATSTSFEGIRKAADQNPAIVIASAHLRELEGVALIHNIAQEMPRGAVKGIVLTDPSDFETPLSQGVTGLARPFTPADALQCVSLLTEMRAVQRVSDGSPPWQTLASSDNAILFSGPMTQTMIWLSDAVIAAGIEVKFAETPADIHSAVSESGIVAAIVDRRGECRASVAALEELEKHAPDSVPVFALSLDTGTLGDTDAKLIRGTVSLGRLLTAIDQLGRSGERSQKGVETRV